MAKIDPFNLIGGRTLGIDAENDSDNSKNEEVDDEIEAAEETETQKKKKAKKQVQEPEEREHLSPEDVDLVFQKFPGVGPVVVPVQEATDFMAALENRKYSTTELRKMLTDLYHENKYWRAHALKMQEWWMEAQKKLREAKAQGQNVVEFPPIPAFINPQLLTQEKKNNDDADYLKNFAHLIGPYIAIGKYLREEDGDKHNPSSMPSIVMTDANGNRYEIPVQYAPMLGINPVQQQQQPQNDQNKDPLANIPVVKRVEPDGSTTYMPFWLAAMQPPQQQQQPQQQTTVPREIIDSLTKLASAVSALHAKIEHSNSNDVSKKAREEMKEQLELFREMRNIFSTPTNPDKERELELEKERIRKEKELAIEKERRMQKAYETMAKILGEDDNEKQDHTENNEKADTIKRGREFIDKMMQQVKKISGGVQNG